jgi:addiction module HigA family antidote
MIRITTHPGEILKEEFLVPLGMSARKLAQLSGVPANRLTEILRGRRGVTADTAIRLGRVLGTSDEFWMNLQQAHDLSTARANGDYSALSRVAA